MLTVNIHEAKTQLSKLLDGVVAGESFVIAKAGKPLAKVVPYDLPGEPNLLGCMRGRAVLNKNLDLKSFGNEEVAALFGDEE